LSTTVDEHKNAGFTPAGFHREPGVEDWRVTSWGPQACFRATSLAEAASLLPSIVEASKQFGTEPDIDLRPEAIVVRIHYRGADHIPAGGPALAAAISRAAAELGLVPVPELIATVDIAVAQHPDVDTRPFWNAILNYGDYWDTDSIDPLRRGPQLSFQDHTVKGRGRTHIDVSVSPDLAQARIDAALAAGGRMVDDSHAPAWWTIASPDNHGIDIATWNDNWD
jgi:4a-hydroxytetrahydrobiopterin dehydratase